MNRSAVGLLMLLLTLVSCAGRREVREGESAVADRCAYTARQVASPIDVDGALEEWRAEEWILLTYRHLPASDLSARAALLWDERCLYVACQVEDNAFNQPYQGSDLWRGDSVHLGFDPLEEADGPAYGADDLELVLALARGKPVTWFYHGSQQGSVGAVELAVLAVEQNGNLVYEAAIPWSTLAPLHPDSMRASGFTLSVNDNDGDPREGFSYITFSSDNAAGLWKGHAQWGEGIFPRWDPTRFGRLIFLGSAAGPGKPAPALERRERPPPLHTNACAAGDFAIAGRLVPENQTLIASASLRVVNEGAKPLEDPWLGFQLYPGIEVERVVDEQGRELAFAGPGQYEEDPGLTIVHLVGSLPPGAARRLTFTYRGIFDGKVSNHIDAHNTWLLQESNWFPKLGDSAGDLEDLGRRNRGPFAMEIATPQGERVVSEGELVESRQSAQGMIWVWRAEALPFGFTAAEYEEVTETVDTVSVTVWTYPEHRDGARKLVETVVECLQFYEELFGPYPDAVFSIAEVDRRGGYGSMPLLLNRQNFEQDPSMHLIAHELAHRWWRHFGDGLHNMHEGFAEYSAAVAVQALRGGELPLRSWLGKYRTASGRERPLSMEQEDYALYRTVAYNKGPYVLHMLRYAMGDEPFFAALRDFYSRVRAHPEPAKLAEFEQICERTTGRELGWFFDQWMRQVTRPEYALGQVSTECRADQFITTAAVRNEGEGRMPVSVVLRTEEGTTSRKIDLAAGAEETLVFTTAHEPVWLEIDPDKWVLQSRWYDDRRALGESEAGHEIPAEQLYAVGRVGPGKTDETALRELVAFYQRRDLDVGSSVALWDLRAMTRYFGMPAELAAQREVECREETEVAGQLPQGAEQGEWSVMVGERNGQLVGEVLIPLRLTVEGRRYQGRALYLAARADDRWRLINFDVSF